MKHICLPGKPLLWGLCLLLVGLVARSQPPTYHPWDWELGIRPVDFASYFAFAGGLYQEFVGRDLAFGCEVYALQRRPNHTFSRLAIGYGGYGGPVTTDRHQMVPQATVDIASFRASACSAEAGFGWELPSIPRKGLDRLRLRAGGSLSVRFLQSQTFRRFQSRSATVYAYIHRFASGGSYWRGTAFLQVEFRLLGAAFIGLEWRYGPNLVVGELSHLTQSASAGSWGYVAGQRLGATRNFGFSFRNPIGLPILSLGYSL